MPADFVEFLTYLFSEVLGRSAYLTDGVQRALGREPRDFAAHVLEPRTRCVRVHNPGQMAATSRQASPL